jgi:hypothetical protein
VGNLGIGGRIILKYEFFGGGVLSIVTIKNNGIPGCEIVW